MRTVLSQDILALAGVLMAQPASRRAALADLLIWRAHVAHKIARRLGRPHPDWGNGTLSGVTAGWPRRGDVFVGRGETLPAVLIVLEALMRRRLALSRGVPIC